jgi:predicted dehydrogenase
MATNLCRWGILGTANIARKNWRAIRNASSATLVAVASRDLERARHFSAECQAAIPFAAPPVSCGSYQELIERSDIDAVYIPLPTAVRKEWVLRAAQAGKHILSEKPCGVTSADVKEMLAACQKHRVQFMDGVMFMHSARLGLMRRVLDSPNTIGPLRRIVSQFSFQASADFLKSNIRVQNELEPLGCLGDLGWYNIRLALWAMNEQLPERVSGRLLATTGSSGIPLEFSGELFFKGDVSAAFYCSFQTENQQWAHVSGSKGYMSLPDFVLPFYGNEAGFEVNTPVFRVQGCDFNMENHTRRLVADEYSNGTANAQESKMIETFSRIVLSGQLEPKWGEMALKTQQVLDACLRSARDGGSMVGCQS